MPASTRKGIGRDAWIDEMKRLHFLLLACLLLCADIAPLVAYPVQPAVAITKWQWIADSRDRADGADITEPRMDARSDDWKNVSIGQDVFHGRLGCAWFRAILPDSALPPQRIHFESVDDNAAVYLNGKRLIYHEVWNDPFDAPVGAAWNPHGLNVLSVLVQNTAGSGGILGGVWEDFHVRPQLHGGEFITSIDPVSGGLIQITNAADPYAMNWVHAASQWGVGWIRVGGQRLDWKMVVPLHLLFVTRSEDASDRPSVTRGTGRTTDVWDVEYQAGQIHIVVQRCMTPQGRLDETYTISNRGTKPIAFSGQDIGIQTPFNDTYAGGASLAVTRRCNAHIWCGGTSAYICATRMGGAAPHLGLVLTQGSIAGYCLDKARDSDERGLISLNPSAIALRPGQSRSISWTLFWHRGWDDFFAKAAAIPGFTRLEADRYTLAQNETATITARGAPPHARLSIDGGFISPEHTRHGLQWKYHASALGEHIARLTGNGKDTFLRIFVTPPPMDLIRSRVLFIVRRQQRNAPGTPLDGAYLIYDNDTHTQVYERRNDHDAGRERVGMGCLIARYLLCCREPAVARELRASLDRFYAFVNRELTDEDGVVYGDVGRQDSGRLYNYPWIAELHVLMYRVTRDPACLRRFTHVIHSLYSRGGFGFYCIGLPISEGLGQLKEAGMASEYREVLGEFVNHADRLAANGVHIPSSEVSYEQSIVAPAVQILLEVYKATHQAKYRTAAEVLYPLMDSFNGRQPDYHLYDIAIRHWDDYWFGKSRQYGDTFPHYWTTITGVAFHDLAVVTNDRLTQIRAEQIVAANLCSFRPDGSASCAYVYPSLVNGSAGAFFDAWANDQDWALDNYLIVMSQKSK